MQAPRWRHAGTSHCIFVRADGKTLPVPARRPIKPNYIKMFLELEGVSLNTLVLTFIAEGLGRTERRA